MAEIGIKGLDELIEKLGRIDALKLMESPMVDAQSLVHGRMRYTQGRPPKPSGSTYTRTLDLLRSIHSPPIRITGKGMEGRIESGLDYAAAVFSDTNQARIHKGRWPTDQQILREEQDKILSFFEDAIVEATR